METLHGKLNRPHLHVFRYREDGSLFMMECKNDPIRSGKNVITHYPAIRREAS
jgi:hypothetical protein